MSLLLVTQYYHNVTSVVPNSVPNPIVTPISENIENHETSTVEQGILKLSPVKTPLRRLMRNITHDLLIVNGRITSDPKGACTWYTHNGSSLVDYVLCSKSIIDRIDLKVEDINPLSDHCTVTTNISLNIPTVHSRNIPDIEYTCTSHTHIPYRWKPNFRKE